jgi:hypothetical protein
MKNFINANSEFIRVLLLKYTTPMLIYCPVSKKYFVTLYKLSDYTFQNYKFELIRK